MANLNKVHLIGNLTRDPELRHTPKGTAVAEFGLAINRVWYDDNKQKQEETTFVDVTLWGRTAEVAQKYLFKGNPCYIEGRLSLETWEDKTTGQKRSKLKVIGESLQLLGGTRPTSSDSAAPRTRDAPPAASYTSDALDQHADDDIPF